MTESSQKEQASSMQTDTIHSPFHGLPWSHISKLSSFRAGKKIKSVKQESLLLFPLLEATVTTTKKQTNPNYVYITAKTAMCIPSSASIGIIWNATWHTSTAILFWYTFASLLTWGKGRASTSHPYSWPPLAASLLQNHPSSKWFKFQAMRQKS